MIKWISALKPAPWWRKVCIPLLAFFWCFGLLLGILAANAASNILIPMMCGAVQCPVSIPGLLAVTVLPFLLSAYAVSFCEPLLLIISTWKAFSFGFCAFGVSLAFGSAGWLVRFLFLYSDGCMIPVLLFYWLRHISGKDRMSRWDFPGCLAASLLIGIIDYCLVSPFLVMLISN